MNLYFSPHNGAETLYGAYTLMVHQPRVIVVLRSFMQEYWNPSVTYQTREAETDAAMRYLGIDWTQWDHPDDTPNWYEIEQDMRACDGDDLDIVYAPEVVDHGHPHFNWIGALADEIFDNRVIHYCTRTTSKLCFPVTPDLEQRKIRALAYYQSQVSHPYVYDLYERSLDEFYADQA